MPNSKLGPHINFVRESDAMAEFLISARPAVAKAVNPDPGFWSQIKQEAPEIFLIGRRHFKAQPWNDPGRVARAILDMGAAHIMDAWEGLNEPNRKRLGDACALDIEVAQLLHREDVRYICGSWPVGVPDIDDWTKSAMHSALRAADFIGVHAYSAPSLDDPRGVAWWLLRHRMWYPKLPDDCKKPLLITEVGIDSGAVHWDPGAQGGWRSFTTAEDYAAQLAWFDAELQADAYVKGALIYQWGSLDPTWDSHDWTAELAALLREYIISQREEPPPPPPPPDWEERALIAEGKLSAIREIVYPSQVRLPVGQAVG